MHKQLIPVEDKVIIRPSPKEDQTSGGVYLPDIAKEETCIGTVISIGPGLKSYHDGKRMEMKVSVGDEVLYSKLSGDAFEFNGERYVIFREVDLLAIIK